MKAYAEYRETGLDWLAKVPKHWEWQYLSQISSEQQIKNVEDKESNVLSLSYGNIIQKKDKDFGLAPKDFTTYQIVFEGNIILRLTDLQNDKRSLRTGLVKETGIITSAYTCLKPKRNPAYLHYLLHSFDTQKVFYGFGGGVRQTISYADIRSMRLPVPPCEEQDRIVAFLDHKIAKIDAFIKNKKKLIELFNEQKQAVINHAVTKGLNPDAEMKDSGVDWLGAVPKHWEVRGLGSFASLQNGISESADFFTKGTPFITYGDVYNNFELPKSSTGVANANEKQKDVYSVKEGDIFFTRTSETIEEIAFSSVCLQTINEAVFSGFLIRVRPREAVLVARYAKYYFRNSLLRNYFVKEMNLVTRASLSQSLLKQLPTVLPPLAEQKEIACYLEERLSTIDAVIAKAEKEITLIQEYKTSLISAVVTGQLDVRDALP